MAMRCWTHLFFAALIIISNGSSLRGWDDNTPGQVRTDNKTNAGRESPDDASASRLLQLLKSRDAQFDNFILKFEKSGSIRRDPGREALKKSFRDWKAGLRVKDKQAQFEPFPEPYDVPYRFSMLMILRGTETTFQQNLEGPPLFDQKDGEHFVPFQKWSNTEGWLRQLGDGAGERSFYVDFDKVRPGSIDEQRMSVEFAFGFGFGSRLRKIEETSEIDGRIRVNGPIQIWTEDDSQAELEFDRDFVLRKATIDCDVHGNLTRFEVSTDGRVDIEGLPAFARNGHFRRTWIGTRRNGKVKGNRKVRNEFSAEFKDVTIGISDEEYSAQTKMEITRDTSIIDKTGGAYKLPVFLPEKQRSFATKYLIAINLLILFCLAFCVVLRSYVRRKRRRQASGD